MPYMKFLSVRSDICRQLPSDSTSRWTPLPLTMQFPLLGLARDFHPLDNAHAERTYKKGCKPHKVRSLFLYRSILSSAICQRDKYYLLLYYTTAADDSTLIFSFYLSFLYYSVQVWNYKYTTIKGVCQVFNGLSHEKAPLPHSFS